MDLQPNLPKKPNSPRLTTRVIKFGGSLLENPRSLDLFRHWHADQLPAVDCLLVGGGVAVDQLRTWDAEHSFQSEAVHFLAVEQMSFNARWLAELMPDWTLWTWPPQIDPIDCEIVRSLAKIVADCTSCHRFLVDPMAWLSQETCLPRDWTVSSDSIAAQLANVVQAQELVLLKSGLPFSHESRQTYSSSAAVDPAFARFSQSIEVLRIVQLTDPAFAELRFGPVTLDDNRS